MDGSRDGASPGGPIERWIDRERQVVERWRGEFVKREQLRINSRENITVICLPIVPRITPDFSPPLRVDNFQPRDRYVSPNDALFRRPRSIKNISSFFFRPDR